MPIVFKNPEAVPAPVGFYSHVAVVPAGTRLLALSGQVGNDADGAFAEGVQDQFAQALANVVAIVGSEGGGPGDIARITCFLTERLSDHKRFRAQLAEVFGATAPAVTLIYVAGLYAPHVKVEVEALAAVAAG